MSTRTYNLQMHTGSGLATQNSGEPTPVRSCIPVTCEVAPHKPDTQPKADATIDEPSYSDVVASRPSSPQKVKETTSSLAGTPGQDELSCALKTQPAMGKPDSGSPDKSLSDKSIIDPPKGQGQPEWTTVKHRHAHSLSSLYRVLVKKVNTEKKTIAMVLTTEQQKAVKTASEALSQQQRQHILHRQEKVAAC